MVSEGTIEFFKMLFIELEKEVKLWPVPDSLIEAVNFCFNQLIAELLNVKDLKQAVALYYWKYRRQFVTLNVYHFVLRAFVVVAMECGCEDKSNAFFIYSYLQGVYPIYPISTSLQQVQLSTYLSSCEIHHILELCLLLLFERLSEAFPDAVSEVECSLKILLVESDTEDTTICLYAVHSISSSLSDAHKRTVTVLNQMGLSLEETKEKDPSSLKVTYDSLYRKFMHWVNEKNFMSVGKNRKKSPSFCEIFQLQKWDHIFGEPVKGDSDESKKENVNEECNLPRKESPQEQYDSQESYFSQIESTLSTVQLSDTSAVTDANLHMNDSFEVSDKREDSEPVRTVKRHDKVKTINCHKCKRLSKMDSSSSTAKKLKLCQSIPKDTFHVVKNENFSVSINAGDLEGIVTSQLSFNHASSVYSTDSNEYSSEPKVLGKNPVTSSSKLKQSAQKTVVDDKFDPKKRRAILIPRRLDRAESHLSAMEKQRKKSDVCNVSEVSLKNLSNNKRAKILSRASNAGGFPSRIPILSCPLTTSTASICRRKVNNRPVYLSSKRFRKVNLQKARLTKVPLSITKKIAFQCEHIENSE